MEGMNNPLALISRQIDRTGFAFVRAPEMQDILETAGLRDWARFAESWDDLGVDAYMADGGRYRRRRFACYRASWAGILRKPHQPHYQSRDYNPLNGGVQRWFEPVSDAIGEHAALKAILLSCYSLFEGLTAPDTRPPSWHVETHQFRIEAQPGQEGHP